MRRPFTLSLIVSVAVCLGIFVGCDSSPSSVQDFEIQPALESSSSLSLVLAEGTAKLSVNYQGLDGPPSVEATGGLKAENTEQTGSPRSGGQQQWTLTYDGDVQGVTTEQAIVQASGGGRSIADTVDVTVSRFLVQSEFAPTFASVADFEERTLTTSGGTTAERTDAVVAENSTGTESLEISGSGTATIERTTSVPGASRFTFLIRPDESTDFTLTFSFTEETGSGTTTHDLDVQVQAGTEWVKYGIALNQIAADFNPVASRAGGNGALQSISMSTDQDVTYYVDQLAFANENQAVAEVHDFEETTLEYNCPELATSQDVADASDGVQSRSVEGGGCFGYNYDLLYADVEAGDVLSFWTKSAQEQTRLVFVQTSEQAGGYTFDNGVDVTIPGSDEWTKVEVPVDSLGENPAALQNAGITNVGFDGGKQILIDQVRFEPGN
jgi:hypothetical protein